MVAVTASARCFEKEIVTLHQARKFARKSRDYMRAYRAGSSDLEVDGHIKLVKTHRSALDTDTAFVMEGCEEDEVIYIFDKNSAADLKK